jgi:hypothetical protein
MRSWISTLALTAGLLAAPRASAAPTTITAPPTLSTTAGLGFSVAALVWSQTGDSLRATLSGEPEGLSYRFLRLRSDYGVVTLGGIIPLSKNARNYELIWTLHGADGHVAAETRTSLAVLPPAHAGGNMAAKVRSLICRHYNYGLDAQEVRSLGPASLPHILAVLRDTTCQDYWVGAVAAAGMLGLPSAVDSLHAFLWNRFSGDVGGNPHDLFKALIYAPVALGMVAPSRPDLVDSLIAWSDPRYWSSLPWHYRTLMGRDLAILMSGRAILALSLIGDARAVAALERLSTNPYDPGQLTYIREAIERQRKVLDRGWQAVREEERLENQE